jgi:DNA-binding response OmpR family regulator
LADAPAQGATGPDGRPAAGVVVVLADDLIWASRLADAVTAAGGTPRRARRAEDLAALLATESAALVIVDLTARAYDGIAAVRAAHGAGARVVAVGQHDDAALRKVALEAGAERVFTYRALFEGGARLLGAWLAR